MSQMKEMYEVINQLKECASTLINATSFLAETFSGTETQTQEIQQKALTLEDVRAILADKSRRGKTAEVKELITSFGADKLSAVKASDYAALLKKAEVL